MEAYRDQYATLFNNGRNVVVMGISVDPDTALANWAHDADFPVVMVSDHDGAIGKLYGAYDEARKFDRRYLFVVGPDGTVTYRAIPFNVLAQASYTGLDSAVDAASGTKVQKEGSP